MAPDTWLELCARWQQDFGAFDDLVVCERTQGTRSGLALLLLRRGEPLVFVKIRHQGAEALSREHRVMRAIWDARPQTFSIPEPLGVEKTGEWDCLVMAAMLSSRQRTPRNPPSPVVHAEIASALRSLPSSAAVPTHWRPMHGDLTPWNLRELPGGHLVLYDWEDAAWGPPDADDVLYRASEAALRRNRPVVHPAQEAVRYWYSRVSASEAGDARDRALRDSLCAVLLCMQDPVVATGT